jgi:stage II sporulation protein AA (anti-sigma F factor antagonist)
LSFGRAEVRIDENRTEDVLVLAPDGPLSAAAAAAALERRLKSVVDRGDLRIVVDLDRVGGLGSHAIRVFLLASRRLSGKGGRLVLAGPSESVRRALEISGFDRELTLAASGAEALERARETSCPINTPEDATPTAVLRVLGGGSGLSREGVPPTDLGVVADEILRILALCAPHQRATPPASARRPR